MTQLAFTNLYLTLYVSMATSLCRLDILPVLKGHVIHINASHSAHSLSNSGRCIKCGMVQFKALYSKMCLAVDGNKSYSISRYYMMAILHTLLLGSHETSASCDRLQRLPGDTLESRYSSVIPTSYHENK